MNRERVWPLLVIFLLWGIFSYPYFFQNKVPFPSTYLVNHFPPWNAYRQYWGPVKNSAMPDIIDQIYPWRYLTIATWKKGELPLWNPYNFSGNPHLANFQSAAFSPFLLFFLVLPFLDSWSILVLLAPLLAGIFTYFFTRELRLSKSGSLIGSIAFMFCGFIVVWMAYGTLSMAISFLPLVLFAIERSFRRFSLSIGFLISVAIASSFFSGHFQTSLYLILLSFAYYLWKAFRAKKSLSLRIGLFYLFGIVLALVQIIPSVQFYNESVRSEIFIQSGGIPLQYLLTLFAPDFYGNPVTRNDWIGNYAEWASFVGIIPLFLALYSLRLYKNQTVSFFLIASVIVFLLAISSPIQRGLGTLKIPVLSTSNPSRIIVLFSFSLAILAAFGADVLREYLDKHNRRQLFYPFIAIVLIISLTWIAIFANSSSSFLPTDKVMLAKKNLLLPSVLFLITIILFVFFTFHSHKRTILICFTGIILFMSFDSLRFATKWMPFDKREYVYPDVPVISAMKKYIGNGRYFGNLGAQVATYYGLSSIEGYDPLYSERYGEFLRTAQNGLYQPAERSVAKIDRHAKYIERVFDVLGVGIIYHPIADTNQSWAYPVWEDPERYSVIYQDELFQLFRNNYVLTRPSLFYRYEIIENPRKNLERFFEEEFDYRKVITLEEMPDFPSEKTTTDHDNAIDLLINTPNKLAFQVASDAPAILFLADTYYPTWQAMVNNKPVKILRANYAFRGVSIPKGESIVVFSNTLL